ncbi:hypothetical protein ACS0TY_013152 [Phlomoides rotata]
MQRGLVLVKQQGVRRIIMESDSLILIAALLLGKRFLSSFWGVVSDIQQLASTFDEVRFHWVRRTVNTVVHAIVLNHSSPKKISRSNQKMF